MSYLQDAIEFFEGKELDLRRQHRIYWLLLDHSQLTDLYQAGREVMLRELRNGPQKNRRKSYFGMTTLQEQAYCEWYCAHLYRGEGEIIELGTFMGSLTKSMVDGLRANALEAARCRKVEVYDLFYWDFVMKACVAGTVYEDYCQEGDWFEEMYRRSLQSWIDRVEVHQADLTKFSYNGDAIEFLMVDVMKYESLCTQVTREFFPKLIPGTGILFHQDYLHFYEAWVHVIQYLLRDFFEPVTAVDGSGAFVFRCTKALSKADCTLTAPLSENWENDLIESAFDWSEHIVGDGARHTVAAARIMMYVHLKRWDEAHKAWAKAAPQYPDSHAFADLKRYCAQAHSLEFGRN